MPLIENAVTLLKKDHIEAKALFKALKAVDALNVPGRESLFSKLKHELDIHTQVEEDIFYPAVRAANHGSEDIIEDSYEDHAQVKQMLTEMAASDKGTEKWTALLEKLEEEVNEHVKEEEDILLPRAQEILGDEKMKELGRQILAEKESLQNSVQ